MTTNIIRTPKEIETKRRIKLSVWAYAYEFDARSLVPDAVFDFESYMIDLKIMTDRPDLDFWFLTNFVRCSGMWIQKHPELEKVKLTYERFYK